jgi:short-subunit dehydrogenase
MKKQGHGSIINISSGSATKGFMAETGYCPSKYGLEGLTQCLAMELFNYNIAVNSLSPSAPQGMILKPSKITASEEQKLPKDITSKYATDDSIFTAFAEAWCFLALQDAHGVTAQRFSSRELANCLSKDGWEATVTSRGNKLTKTVYVPYDLPDQVQYDTMLKDKIGDLGMKTHYFDKTKK